MLSGGASSYLAAKRAWARRAVGRRFWLLFADTGIEDEDLYRFLRDVERRIVPVTVLKDGRTPWDVFREVRFLGNARIDPCSRILKRELLRRWLEDNCKPETTTVYLGFTWDEAHRVERARKFWGEWRVEAPMADPPYLSRDGMLDELRADGIEIPRLYRMGFDHNNCGGFCVKAGQAQFAHLLKTMPERYAEHEAQEEALRATLDKDVAIMTDRSGGGPRRPLTMRAFRERLEATSEYDQTDFGACSCFDEGPSVPRAGAGSP
jgi:hypothetical protein